MSALVSEYEDRDGKELNAGDRVSIVSGVPSGVQVFTEGYSLGMSNGDLFVQFPNEENVMLAKGKNGFVVRLPSLGSSENVDETPASFLSPQKLIVREIEHKPPEGVMFEMTVSDDGVDCAPAWLQVTYVACGHQRTFEGIHWFPHPRTVHPGRSGRHCFVPKHSDDPECMALIMGILAGKDGRCRACWGLPPEEAARAETPAPTPYEEVHHPPHYNAIPGIECIDVIEHMTHNVGAAVKYCWRHGLKPGQGAEKDLRKAIWYLEREIERLKKSGGAT